MIDEVVAIETLMKAAVNSSVQILLTLCLAPFYIYAQDSERGICFWLKLLNASRSIAITDVEGPGASVGATVNF